MYFIKKFPDKMLFLKESFKNMKVNVATAPERPSQFLDSHAEEPSLDQTEVVANCFSETSS